MRAVTPQHSGHDDVAVNLIDKALAFLEENIERNDKVYDCDPFKNKVEDILSQEEAKGIEELRITEQEIYDRSDTLGGLHSAYEESLTMLRTSLSRSIETELDETLNEVITAMKDKVCGFLGGNDGGKLAKYFGTDTHELADKVVEFITTSGRDDEMSDILRGFRFLSSWRMSYRSFLQHRLRTCLNDLDPLDKEAMRSAGYPETSQEASEQLLRLYRQSQSSVKPLRRYVRTFMLACMYRKFEEILSGSIIADTGTFNTLQASYEKLQAEANSKDLEFGIGIENTENLREYAFTIKGKNANVPVRFFDFPGGWIDAAKSQPENYNRVIDIIKRSHVIIVAVSTPYLMEAAERYKKEAHVDDIKQVIKQSFMESEGSKLILIVPIKCEKYTRNDKDKDRLAIAAWASSPRTRTNLYVMR